MPRRYNLEDARGTRAAIGYALHNANMNVEGTVANMWMHVVLMVGPQRLSTIVNGAYFECSSTAAQAPRRARDGAATSLSLTSCVRVRVACDARVDVCVHVCV